MIELGKFEGVLGVNESSVFLRDKTDLVKHNLNTKEEIRVPFDFSINKVYFY